MDDYEEDVPSEQSSLLSHPDFTESNAEPTLLPLVHSPRLIVFMVSSVVFVIMFGAFLMITPSLRVYEDIICHHYYDKIEGEGHISLSGKIEEELCKEPKIQEELAIIVGGVQFLESVPGLVLAYPWGILADRIGRKRVFGFGVLGAMLSQAWILMVCWWWQTFPLRLVWISPVFQIFGGGGSVIQSVIYAIISDISTEANRSNHFFLVMVGYMGGQFLGPSVASAMMLYSPWLPLCVGFWTMLAGGALMAFVPETLHRKSNSESTTINSTTSSKSQSIFAKLKSDFFGSLDSLRCTVSVPLILLLLTFALGLEGQQAVDLIQRYISKRFSWTIAQTGPLISLRALMNLILLLAILPFLSHTLTSPTKGAYLPSAFHFNLSTQAKDLLLAHLSLVLQIAGFAFLGLSAFSSTPRDTDSETALPILLAIAGLIIFTLGMGFAALCRSLITTLVDPQHVARLYAVIAVVEIFGALITAPMLAGLYALGLRLARHGRNRGFLGLPFWGLVGLNIVAGGGIMWLRLGARRALATDVNDDDDDDGAPSSDERDRELRASERVACAILVWSTCG